MHACKLTCVCEFVSFRLPLKCTMALHCTVVHQIVVVVVVFVVVVVVAAVFVAVVVAVFVAVMLWLLSWFQPVGQ